LERRIAGELAAIERTGLAEFFLLCAEIVRNAHRDGIAAQGRGSAGDSVIAYLLGITRVDPIRHNLIFERFLNEGRESYPDVDVDFASDRRDEVIDAVLERFGPRHVALVCTFITYRSRSAARDVGLALGLPEALVDEGARKLEAHDPSVVGAQLAADPRWGSLLRSNITAPCTLAASSPPPNHWTSSPPWSDLLMEDGQCCSSTSTTLSRSSW
jgi:error-prone DNA polymerase